MSGITNINDAAGVVALLDQLKASPQWQEIAAGIIVDQADASSQPLPPEERPAGTEPSDRNESVASLLSQLGLPAMNRSAGPTNLARVSETRPAELEENRRNVSFRAALPILSELAEHESFLSGVKKLREVQNSLERDLWSEREAIYSKYHEKFKTTQTKAQMTGTSVSRYEIDTMTDAFKKEIQSFDNGRAISAWDGLVSRQQQELERMGVPAMFHTTVSQDRERQQQVIQVLETVARFR